MSFFSNRRQNQAEPARKDPTTLSAVSLTQRQPIGFETVLGTNSTLNGTLESRANIRLDGEFTGTLKITGNVLVGETAEINADIHAKNVSIAGAVRGNVSGKKVQLLRTAKVWGDISATALTTEEGAFIDGKISMNAPQVEQNDAEIVDAADETIILVSDEQQETDLIDEDSSSADDDDTAVVKRSTLTENLDKIANASERIDALEDDNDNNSDDDIAEKE